MTTSYSVSATSAPGGAGELSVFGSPIRFDGASERDGVHPGPAELLCGALAACLLKNVERFSSILPFRYSAASVRVDAVRDEKPPRFSRFHYELRLVTPEPEARVMLLHKNLRKFGTVSGTLQLAAEVDGEILAVESLHD